MIFFMRLIMNFPEKKKYRTGKFLRKPNIGMFIQAKKKWEIILKKSYVVGDNLSDMSFANNCNLRGVLINKNDNLYKKVLSIIKSKNL